MITALIIIFAIGYFAITLEHTIKISKSATALITAVLCWTLIISNAGDKEQIIGQLSHHLSSISEIVFFLLGAMTIVELIDAHDGFQNITERIKTTNKTKLVWLISLITFFLSAVLDNLTSTIVMMSILNKLIQDKKTKWLLLGLVIISSNAGGAFSPIGDVTTTMLWIGGQISPLNIIKQTFLASLVSMVVPTLIINYIIKGKIELKAYVENNLITTQTTNSNLQLSGAGTGSVEIENFRINDNTITNTVGDMTFTPATGVTVFTGTGSVRLPAGGDAGRPITPTVGMIRYNTDSNLFEGYDGSWTVLQGVYDLDRNTYITPELTPGANDNTIRFYSNSALVADVNSTRFDVNTLQVDSITISGNTLTTTGVNQDLILNGNGTGIIRIENLNFQSNTITNYVSNAPIVFETTGDGYVDVSQAGGVRIPYGDAGTRPSVPVIGITRYNTQDLQVEIYDGASWVSVAGAGGGVSVLGAEELAVKYALTLG